MSTIAQITANQLNAQASTGPRTEEGKSASSKNATTHGLTAATPVIRSAEEQTQFDQLAAEYFAELRPYTATEQTQFKQLIVAAWNIDRCHRLEAGLAASTETDPLLDDEAYKILARIESYRLRAERLFHRNLKALKAIPANRFIPQNQPKPEPLIYAPPIQLSSKIGRNEPCPCKSGLKYKYCCINRRQADAHAAN